MKFNPTVCKWCEVDVVNPSDGTVERTLAMVPAVRYRNQAKRQYGDGREGVEYPLIPSQPRDRVSHNHYFAALQNGFDNLPERIAARWPTVEHMRKWLLIETNWCEEKEFTFEGRGAETQANRLALFIRTEDEHARITKTRVDGGEDNREEALDAALAVWTANGAVPERERLRLAIRATLKVLDRGGTWKVIVRKAMSQEFAAMGREAFQASKWDVLNLLEQFTNVPKGSLMKHAGKAA